METAIETTNDFLNYVKMDRIAGELEQLDNLRDHLFNRLNEIHVELKGNAREKVEKAMDCLTEIGASITIAAIEVEVDASHMKRKLDS